MKINKQKIKQILLSGAIFLGAYEINAQCTVPSSVTATPSVICAGSTTSLNATSVGSSINWYTVPVGGASLGSSASGVNFPIIPGGTATYYAEAFQNGPPTTFSYTGSVQTVTIPAGITQITVDVMGAAGGGNTVVAGGNGGRVVAVISVTPGQVYNIFVGGQGNVIGTAGYNGGGSGFGGSIGTPGSGGGGASDIRFGGIALTDRIIVSGGGGGGTSNGGNAIGGSGGGLTGGNGAPGTNPWVCTNTIIPTGGSQVAGGLGGTSTSCAWNGFNGVLGVGGNSYNNYRCAGGGGGYYGGGGAHNGMSGAGGSSYAVPSASSVVHTQGFQSGDGQVIITGLTVGCVNPVRTAVNVTVNPSPTPTITINAPVCVGANLTFTGQGGATYNWTGPNGFTSALQNPNIANVTMAASGTYSLLVTTGSCSNITTASISITPNPTLSISGGTVAICAGSSVTLTASGAATYSWNNGAVTSTIAPTPTANASYTVIGTAAGCTGTAVKSITVSPIPTIAVTGNTLICGTGTNVLTANGANTYSWNNGATTASISVSPTITTNYTVVGTNTVGNCINTFTTAITVAANPTVSITGGTAAVCPGSAINLTASGANTYSWNTGAATSTIAPTPTANASYTVVGTNTAGCTNIAVQAVTVNAAPSVSIIGTSSICVGQNATLTASGANTYSWNTGSALASIVVNPTITTNYTVNGTSTVTGCSASTTANLIVSPCSGLNSLSAKINGLSVYPNPSNGEFTIELNNGLNKTIEVTDLTGRVVLTSASSKDKVNVNMANLANGIYYVKIQSDNAVEVIKIVKQ